MADEVQAVKDQEAGEPETNQSLETANQPVSEPKAGSKEYNFRQLERERDEYRRQAEDQRRYTEEVLSLVKGNAQVAQPVAEETLPELGPNDIPEWQHVKKTYSALQGEINKLKNELVQKEKAELPRLAKAKFPDFESVVTVDRIKKLEQENPALAQAFTLSSDPFTATYTYLKAVHQTKKADPVALEEAEKILENAGKPISSNATSSSRALKNAQAFQKKSKEQLYKEMTECARRVN